MVCLPDYSGIHLYAAADERNHSLFGYKQPGVKDVLVCKF
jgi:VanZ family protein